MKLLICAFALVAAASAAPQYAPVPVPVGPVYNPQALTKEGLARIVEQVQDQQETGAYSWNYKTENGISAGETNNPAPAGPHGEPAPNVAGGYSYTAPDGTPISITYRAGEEGFVAEGPAIPVAPPIPEEILRSLAWNAAHPEEEAQWDPDYNKRVPQPIYQGRQ